MNNACSFCITATAGTELLRTFIKLKHSFCLTIKFYSLHTFFIYSVSPDQTFYLLSSILQFSPHNYCRSDLISVQMWLVVSHLPAKDYRLFGKPLLHQQPLLNPRLNQILMTYSQSRFSYYQNLNTKLIRTCAPHLL